MQYSIFWTYVKHNVIKFQVKMLFFSEQQILIKYAYILEIHITGLLSLELDDEILSKDSDSGRLIVSCEGLIWLNKVF